MRGVCPGGIVSQCHRSRRAGVRYVAEHDRHVHVARAGHGFAPRARLIVRGRLRSRRFLPANEILELSRQLLQLLIFARLPGHRIRLSLSFRRSRRSGILGRLTKVSGGNGARTNRRIGFVGRQGGIRRIRHGGTRGARRRGITGFSRRKQTSVRDTPQAD